MRISGFEALQQTYGLGAKVDTKVSYYVKETCYVLAQKNFSKGSKSATDLQSRADWHVRRRIHVICTGGCLAYDLQSLVDCHVM